MSGKQSVGVAVGGTSQHTARTQHRVRGVAGSTKASRKIRSDHQLVGGWRDGRNLQFFSAVRIIKKIRQHFSSHFFSRFCLC